MIKLAILKFSGLVKPNYNNFQVAEEKRLSEREEAILHQNAKYFLLAGGVLTAEEMVWLTTAERVALVSARKEIETENRLELEQLRRLEDADVQQIRDLNEAPKYLTESEKIKAYLIAGVLASRGS